MKNTLLVSFLMLFLAATVSFPMQNDSTNSDNTETLFGNFPLKVGGYGGPEVKVTNINNQVGFMKGGKAGLIFNSMFSVGGGGYSLETNHDVSAKGFSGRINFSYGGLFLEYINSSNNLVHFTFNTLIGGGSASYSDLKEVNVDDWFTDNSPVFVVEPALTADLNLTKYIRLSLGAGYRFVSGLDLKNLSDNSLNGYSVNLGLKIGMFDEFHVPRIIKKIKDEIKAHTK